MGRHTFNRIHGFEDAGVKTNALACENCGIVSVNCSFTDKLPCPPWSSTGEGDKINTDANRAREAGEVNELRTIRAAMTAVWPKIVGQVSIDQARAWNDGAAALDRLIQKHEGLARS
jgi:hypothetical protein